MLLLVGSPLWLAVLLSLWGDFLPSVAWRASAGIESPLLCISSISIWFILILRECIVLSSLLPFFTIGKWSVIIVVLDPFK